MAVYRQLQTSFWQDPFVLDLTPEEKFFYIYIMTNSKTTQCGIYELPKRIVEIETGYTRETLDKYLTRFQEYGKILYSEGTKEIMILNWMKYNKINSPKVKSCIVKELSAVKNRDFVNRYLSICKQYEYPIDTVFSDDEQEEEKEEEDNNKRKEEIKEQQQEEKERKPEEKPSWESVVVGDRPLHVFASVSDMYSHYFQLLANPTMCELLHSYLDDGMQLDAIAWSMRNAVEIGKGWAYAKRTIENFFQKGIRTAEQAEIQNQNYLKERTNSQRRGNRPVVQDKLPGSVQRQLAREEQGGKFLTQKKITDDPELKEMFEALQNEKKNGGRA
ncbi:DnaD domain protein [Brevibacillus laterosporus]|uniref:DnaD domain protein n=2 Tax=Brevibacillus laterosporus TaxID=1465 RepID=UPI000CE49004|nr:DnaD domain protein [Brevibacillus laterosporus]MED1664523.1 DnaD domain protein [Brevibacillus laterosporus]MED1669989.1 DnaD domain protein [Brevibacillus laterosporus]MED1717318.1 DnaD domain protein [Brevibacillus laterosporus]PPA82363.1 DNA replication protein DnaD [Brevibacillus laterosporus]